MPAAEKTRDAQRSRAAILDAAEELFSERGFGGTSLSDIGAAARLSRQTPSYFFGSKEQLYTKVLERLFAARQEATSAAFAPVHAWCEGTGDLASLRAAFTDATEGYLDFLMGRPGFVRLVVREEVDGGERLRATPRASTAMRDAFSALRALPPDRGLRPFALDEAILLYIALTFAPLAFRSTLMLAFERSLEDPATRRRHIEMLVDELMHLLAG